MPDFIEHQFVKMLIKPIRMHIIQHPIRCFCRIIIQQIHPIQHIMRIDKAETLSYGISEKCLCQVIFQTGCRMVDCSPVLKIQFMKAPQIFLQMRVAELLSAETDFLYIFYIAYQ